MNIEKRNLANIFILSKKEIKNIDFIHCNEPTQTLEQVYNTAVKKPDILINGGFFNTLNGEPVMDFINDYNRISSDSTTSSFGIGVTTTGELKFGRDFEIWKDFLAAYPPLVISGVCETLGIAKEIDGIHKRTVLGYNDDSVFIIVYDYPGATLKDAAYLAKDIGCKYAINLDGGGSTRLLYKGTKTYAAAMVNRPVDNVIAFYLYEQLYRVQLGAFSSKDNADNFCNQIKLLPGYENAYVRFVESYYKVQVGAFSIYENAKNMLNDLRNKGYNGFITTA